MNSEYQEIDIDDEEGNEEILSISEIDDEDYREPLYDSVGGYTLKDQRSLEAGYISILDLLLIKTSISLNEKGRKGICLVPRLR